MPIPEIIHHGTIKAKLHYIKVATVSLDLTHEDATKLAIMLLNATQEEGTISVSSIYRKLATEMSVFSRTTEK